jgi:hypothetical protein
MAGDVLKDTPKRFDCCDDSADRRPEMSGILVSRSAPSDGKRLAGVAANDAVHQSSNALDWDGVDIRPDGGDWESALGHAERQDAARRVLPLDVSDDAHSSAEGGLKPQVEAADPAAHAKDAGMSHIHNSLRIEANKASGDNFPASRLAAACASARCVPHHPRRTAPTPVTYHATPRQPATLHRRPVVRGASP